MTVDTLTSITNTQSVHQKHDAERVGSDGQSKQGEQHKGEHRQRQPDATEPHPVTNEQGQTTGKVIDTTA